MLLKALLVVLALDGAFGALYGAFGGFGALTLIPVLAIWERCGGGWSGLLAVIRVVLHIF